MPTEQHSPNQTDASHAAEPAAGDAASRSPSRSPLTSLGSTPRLSSRSASARSTPVPEALPHVEEPDSGWAASTLVSQSLRESPAPEEELHYNPPFGLMDRAQDALYQEWTEAGYPAQPTIQDLNRALGRIPDALQSDSDPSSREPSLVPETPLAGPAEALPESRPRSPSLGLDSQQPAAPFDWQHDRQPNQEELAAMAEVEANPAGQSSHVRKHLRSGREYGGEPAPKRRRQGEGDRDSRSRDRSPDIGL